MQLSQDTYQGQFILQAYENNTLIINNQVYELSLIIGANHLLTHCLPIKINALKTSDWQPLIELKPEIVLIGTGHTLQFINPILLQVFYQQRIGVEVMTTQAACRTLAVLLAENRKAFAALFS
ncbi:MAG: hypothetical protein A3E87_00770 [Gammaproteobacteria bacterium RIFCSPHIGHO2_12_FULL_35_23]|nr:MAG: hypothetical protein A3E87_00770 [Gammaproteobacteria bacterium RIFCSPHIGHO2_12_FULL_35_23]